jgi:hypothetical protein
MDRHHENSEQHELITDLVHAIAALEEEREAFHRERAEIALGVVNLERHAQAMSIEVERLKTRLAGITPTGRDA